MFEHINFIASLVGLSTLSTFILWILFNGSYAYFKGVSLDKGDTLEQFTLILLACVIGLVAGVLTGQSREPAVSAVVPAVLSLIGILAGVIFARAQTPTNNVRAISIMAGALGLTILLAWGAQIGAGNRSAWEQYEEKKAIGKIENAQQFELNKIEYQTKLDVAKAKRIANIRSGVDLVLTGKDAAPIVIESQICSKKCD